MQRAGSLLGKLPLAKGVDNPELRACAAWKAAAGKKIAEHTRAVALVRGSLVVEVEDIVWQRQLASLGHFIVRNLAKVLGEPLVTDLDFRPVPPRRRPQRAEQARPNAPADESGQIGDPVMRGLFRESKKRETA